MASEAIDDAIAHLDGLIASLEPRSSGGDVKPASAATPATADAPLVSSSSQGEASPDVVAPTQEKAVEQADGGVVEQPEPVQVAEQTKSNVLDVPRKKPLKTPGATPPKPSVVAPPADADNFDKAHLQVGLVQSVDNHPVSEKLYCCKVEVANGEIRKVVAGLRKFIPSSELVGKKVCVILNLKPAKLAGEVSEAMILAGDARSQNGDEIVKVLEPPPEVSVGDRVYIEGGAPSSSPAKQLSSKIWEKIVPLLKVEGGIARFNGKPLVTSAGVIKVPFLPDGAGIH